MRTQDFWYECLKEVRMGEVSHSASGHEHSNDGPSDFSDVFFVHFVA